MEMSTWWTVSALFVVLALDAESRLIGHYLSAVDPSGHRKPVVHELQKKGVVEESSVAKSKFHNESFSGVPCSY